MSMESDKEYDRKYAEWKSSVEGEEYYKALQDGRCLRWRPIETAPDDRDIIVGGHYDGVEPNEWHMRRCKAGHVILMWGANSTDERFVVRATHWCEDMLGTPYIVVRTPPLQSVNGMG